MKPSSDVPQDRNTSHSMIYLLRHGVVRSPADGKRYVGWQDYALSDEGLAQAGLWADYFTGAGLEHIYCSDLARCHETARIIGAHCSVEPKALAELREVCLGAWEGQRFATVQTLYPQAFEERGDHIADHRPPGGESFRDLQARVWPVFDALVRRRCGQTLIVTHAGVIRVLLCHLLGMPLENLFSLGQSLGALTIVEVRPGGHRIQALNLLPPAHVSG